LNKNSRIILGIDPGTATLGFGAISCIGNRFELVEYGVVTTPAKQEPSLRLLHIYESLTELVAKVKPDLIAVERLFFTTNVTTAMSVAEARGIVLLVAASAKIKVVEATPLQVKQAITGYGKADKKQMQQMVKTILGMPEIPKPDDAADALAIAITSSTKLMQR
jgi:crossover junction endodeoxyribonuclease RuvC